MIRKTERIYAGADLNGSSVEEAERSFSFALYRLDATAKFQKREVLFDTLEVRIERKPRVVALNSATGDVYTTDIQILVSAEAVLK